PLGRLLELAALYGPDLHPAATLVVRRRDVQRRHQSTQGKTLDLLHAFLDILASGRGATLALDRIADRLEVDRCHEHPAIVDHRIFLLLRRLLALRLVHGVDVFDHRVVVADAGELHGIVALGPPETAGRHDIAFRGAPHHRYHLAQRISLALQLLDR